MGAIQQVLLGLNSGSSLGPPWENLLAFYPLVADADDSSGNGNNLTNNVDNAIRLTYNTPIGSPTVGELITGVTSGANGIVSEDTGTVMTLMNQGGTFQNGEVITGDISLTSAFVTSFTQAIVTFSGSGANFEGFNWLSRASLLSGVAAFTLTLWLKTPNVLVEQMFIGDCDGASFGICAEIWDFNGNFRLLGTTDGTGFFDNLALSQFPDDTLQFLVIRYDGVNVSFQVNNGTAETVAITGNLVTLLEFTLGNIPAYNKYLTGKMQYVGVFNVAKSPTDLTAIYNAGVPIGP